MYTWETMHLILGGILDAFCTRLSLEHSIGYVIYCSHFSINCVESLTAFFVYLCSMPKRVKEDANSAERAIAGKHKAARINVPICGCLCARPGELLHVDTLRTDFTIRCRCMHCGPNGRCTVMLNDVGAVWSYFLTGNILCESCRE